MYSQLQRRKHVIRCLKTFRIHFLYISKSYSHFLLGVLLVAVEAIVHVAVRRVLIAQKVVGAVRRRVVDLVAAVEQMLGHHRLKVKRVHGEHIDGDSMRCGDKNANTCANTFITCRH